MSRSGSGVLLNLDWSDTSTKLSGAVLTHSWFPVAARWSPSATSSKACSLALYRYTPLEVKT
jgi:hypothetical protein